MINALDCNIQYVEPDSGDTQRKAMYVIQIFNTFDPTP